MLKSFDWYSPSRVMCLFVYHDSSIVKDKCQPYDFIVQEIKSLGNIIKKIRPTEATRMR